MGIRLFVEVLDYAPPTLTHREKLFLAVLAEDARDTTRTTWSSVQSPKILHRGDVSRTQAYEVIKALVAKGALERVSAGQKNTTAKYRIPPLAPSQSPENRDAETPSQSPDSQDTDESQSPGTPDPEPVLESPGIRDADIFQSPAFRDTEPESQSPENWDADAFQSPGIRDFSVPESGTPTPSTPQTRSPQYGDGPDDAPVTAQTIVGEWLERVDKRPPASVIGQMAKQIRVLLEDDGIDPDDIRRGIAKWMAKGLHPSTLPSVVNEVMNAGPPRPQPGTALALIGQPDPYAVPSTRPSGAAEHNVDVIRRARLRRQAREQEQA